MTAATESKGNSKILSLDELAVVVAAVGEGGRGRPAVGRAGGADDGGGAGPVHAGGDEAAVGGRPAGRGGRAQGPSGGRRKKGRVGRRRRLKGAPGRGTLAKEKPPIFGMIQRGGQIVIRMLADIVILSNDIFQNSSDTLKDTSVAMTIFDGKVVYQHLPATSN